MANVDAITLSNEEIQFYFAKKKTTYNDSTKNLSKTDIITMLEFFIDNVLVIFDGRAFQQKIVILMRQTVLTFSQT